MHLVESSIPGTVFIVAQDCRGEELVKTNDEKKWIRRCGTPESPSTFHCENCRVLADWKSNQLTKAYTVVVYGRTSDDIDNPEARESMERSPGRERTSCEWRIKSVDSGDDSKRKIFNAGKSAGTWHFPVGAGQGRVDKDKVHDVVGKREMQAPAGLHQFPSPSHQPPATSQQPRFVNA